MDDSNVYLHCARCLNERPENESPRDYARLSIGATPAGDMVVWCNRHNEEVAHIANEDLSKVFSEVVGAPCANCGGSCSGEGETFH